ncbi:unnamed protein product, partial [Rotaria socialis]
LIQVKNEQHNIYQELNQARELLSNCSAIDKPVEWSALLNNVIKLAVKLADIEKELKQLGHEHAINNHGTLPY